MTNKITSTRSSEPKQASLRMPFMNFSRTFAAISAASLTLGLIGCSAGMPANTGSPITVTPGQHTVGGRVMGGQSAIVGANIYLYAVGTGGYGSASSSLLTNAVLTNSPSNSGQDTNGNYYVTTDSNGNFGITGDYSCPSGTSLIYLVSAGGDAGSGSNSALYIMSALGNCNTVLGAANSEFFTVNEVSTVASVYALAPYMTLSGTLGASATHIGAPATTAGLAGITNAFAEVPNVISLSLGGALTNTPAGNGVVPANLINALANAVAFCVNSNGGPSTCSGTNQLLNLTTVNSITPLDTIAATLSIAQNPGHNVTGIVNNDSYIGAPFSTSLSSANDLTMSVAYTGNGINTPQGVAIDSNGNAWVVNAGSNAVVELAAATGSALTGGGGYTGGTFDAPVSVAVDTAGNVWVANCGGACSGDAVASSVSYLTLTGESITGASNLTGGALTGSYGISLDGTNRAFIANSLNTAVSAFNSSGTVAGSSGYTATYQSNTTAAAVDTAGNVWTVSPTANAVTEFTPSSGDTTPFTAGANTYVGSGVSYPFAIAIDASNRQWVVDQSNNKVSVLNAGAPIGGSPFSLGGLSTPNGIALDGLGTAWISNANGSISAFTSAGAAVSLSTGFKPGGNYANGIAVDGSGSLWVTDCGSYCGGSGNGTVYQVIGAAAPVVTPIADGVANSQLATRP